VALAVVVCLVALLATILASVVGGNAPTPWITIVASLVVIVGGVVVARWFWRNARTIGRVMDAADRVAGGDYAARVGGGARPEPLERLTTSFDQMAERLETNEERRRELFADVAHELRTPLQVIRGTTEGMADGLYPVGPDRLRLVLEQVDVMARLLEDLRTLSMADAGVLPLDRTEVNASDAIEHATDAFAASAEAGGIALRTSAERVRIHADPVRLEQILANLLMNAIAHTPRGGIVTVGAEQHGDGVLVTVRDTGSGIAPDQMPFVFDRFVTSADTGGTGLGLAIAKRLVEAHGGTIEAITPSEGGTEIWFTIPA
jgi:two-component system sensor histidine kinase BaeS